MLKDFSLDMIAKNPTFVKGNTMLFANLFAQCTIVLTSNPALGVAVYKHLLGNDGPQGQGCGHRKQEYTVEVIKPG